MSLMEETNANQDVDFGFKVGLAEFEKSKRYGK
jgi:hypothetical protein